MPKKIKMSFASSIENQRLVCRIEINGFPTLEWKRIADGMRYILSVKALKPTWNKICDRAFNVIKKVDSINDLVRLTC